MRDTAHLASTQIIEGAVASGQVVIVGRGAQAHLAQRNDVLHVRIVAPLEARIAYVTSREVLDRAAAQARILQKDQEHARYHETFYHRRPSDPHLYDLVLNTGILDLESAVEVISFVLERKANRLSIPAQELGPVAGLSRYPDRPENFHLHTRSTEVGSSHELRNEKRASRLGIWLFPGMLGCVSSRTMGEQAIPCPTRRSPQGNARSRQPEVILA